MKRPRFLDQYSFIFPTCILNYDGTKTNQQQNKLNTLINILKPDLQHFLEKTDIQL